MTVTADIAKLPPSNWQPEQNIIVRACVGKLGEEAAELAVKCARILIQGLDEKEPITEVPNRLALENEIADVSACMLNVVELLKLDEDHLGDRSERKFRFQRAWTDSLGVSDGT